MQVQIGERASVERCACETPLEHWQKYSGVPLPGLCCAMACPGMAATGALVRPGEAPNQPWYIVPLCMDHAAQCGAAIELIPDAQLVLAKPRHTCRRQGARF